MLAVGLGLRAEAPLDRRAVGPRGRARATTGGRRRSTNLRGYRSLLNDTGATDGYQYLAGFGVVLVGDLHPVVDLDALGHVAASRVVVRDVMMFLAAAVAHVVLRAQPVGRLRALDEFYPPRHPVRDVVYHHLDGTHGHVGRLLEHQRLVLVGPRQHHHRGRGRHKYQRYEFNTGHFGYVISFYRRLHE